MYRKNYRVVLLGTSQIMLCMAALADDCGLEWDDGVHCDERLEHGMVYDSDRHVTVVFGGITPNGLSRETLETRDVCPTFITDEGPAARRAPSMTYHRGIKKTFLFGGLDDNGKPLGDTWLWDGETWESKVDGGDGPSARAAGALAYCEEDDYVLLFGGSTGTEKLGETWIWDGSWRHEPVQDEPSPRSNPAVAYDAQRKMVVLYGGNASGFNEDDTWEWDCGERQWTRACEQECGPPAIAGGRMAYDRCSMVSVLVGGFPGNNHVWQWNGQNWTFCAVPGGPSGPYYDHGMVYRDSKGDIVAYGGFPSRDEAWTLTSEAECTKCNGNEVITKAQCKTKRGRVIRLIVVAKRCTPFQLYTADLDTREHKERKARNNGRVKFKFNNMSKPPCGDNQVVLGTGDDKCTSKDFVCDCG